MLNEQLAKRLQVYLVTDERSDVESLLDTVEAAVAGGVTVVQLRRKKEDGRQLIELGRAIRRITREHGALYVVNDRIDIALLTDADGVHVGQSDISCQDARRLLGADRLIGVSVVSTEEAFAAQAAGADYLGVGSMYPTQSKADADMCSLEELQSIANHTSIPLVAIGGITKERIPELCAHGAHGVAVVSAIMQAQDPHAAAAEMKQLF